MTAHGRQLTPGERAFFDTLFQRLEAAGVPAVLLRNYLNFPAEIGHDLDVYFRRSDLNAAVKIFREALAKTGGEVMHIQELDYVLAVWFRAGRDEAQAIHLDFFHGTFTWHNLTYLTDDELLAASRPFLNFKILRPAHEALNLFLTSLMWGSFFKLRYRERLRELLRAPEESAEFHRLLARAFGEAAQPPFDILGEEVPTKPEQRRYAAQLRRALKRRQFLRRPFATTFRLCRHWRREFANGIWPPGTSIAILGPDGSGKSTVIAALKERIGDYFGETMEHHWRPALLPDVGSLFGKRKTDGPVTNPHGKPTHSVPVSIARVLYYWLDYWLGYPWRVRKPAGQNQLVIFDRYAPDMWCDPRRYRLRLPKQLAKVICRCVPQPDLTFVLVAPAETIHQRKGEVPLETLRELLRNYQELAQQGGNVRAVDCSRPVADIADEIAASVRAQLKARTERYSWFK